jgi:hypothetical protein
MEFLSYLATLWNTPAVDLSSTMLSEKFINMSKSQIAEINTANRKAMSDQLAKVLSDVAKIEAAQLDGLSNLTIYGEDLSDSNGNIYSVSFLNGVPSVRDKDTSKANNNKDNISLVFDSTDVMDYNNRYFSIDAPIRSNDAADVAFFRIVNANDPKTIIFPNYQNQYIAPGISQNKFRQFILMSLGEASQERMQIVETSEDFQLLFYGRRPEVLQIQGILKNTMDNPWNMNMLFLWDNYMRGTKLAEQGNILQLYADRNLYSGYPFGFQRSKVAPNDFIVTFSFSLIVKERLSSEQIYIQ